MPNRQMKVRLRNRNAARKFAAGGAATKNGTPDPKSNTEKLKPAR